MVCCAPPRSGGRTRGRRNEEAGLDTLGEAEHVERALERRLDRLDGVVLVVRGRGRAGQVVDLVDLDHEGLDDVVPDELEVGVADPVRDLVEGSVGRCKSVC
jgi:hypothetical protein